MEQILNAIIPIQLKELVFQKKLLKTIKIKFQRDIVQGSILKIIKTIKWEY